MNGVQPTNTWPKATAISGSQDIFRATRYELHRWSAGWLWARHQVGQQDAPSCPCGSAGGFPELFKIHHLAFRKASSTFHCPKSGWMSTHRRIPIRETLKAKVSFCSYLCRWHDAAKEEEEVIRHHFPRTKEEENRRVFFIFFSSWSREVVGQHRKVKRTGNDI